MVLIEVIDILTADDVDLRVPVVVKGVEGGKPFLLLGGEGGEVFGEEGHCNVERLKC
jgi:hypothetical protein